SSRLSSENWSSPFAAGRRDDRHAVVAARVDSFDQRSSSGAWLAACDPAEGSFGVLVRLLILTGQRRGEGSGMQRREGGDDRIWRLPGSRTKNGQGASGAPRPGRVGSDSRWQAREDLEASTALTQSICEGHKVLHNATAR